MFRHHNRFPACRYAEFFIACPLIVLNLLLLISCSSSELIISKYNSAESTPFVIGILASGVLLGLLFYNIFLAISTKEQMFLYFTVMMILLSILQIFSTYERFLFQLTYNRVTILTHALFITFLLFFEDFFQIPRHHRRLSSWNKISILIIAAYTLVFLLLKFLLPQAQGLHRVIDFVRELFVFYTNFLFLANCIIAMAWMKKETLIILIAFIPPAIMTSLNAMQIFPFMQHFEQFMMIMMQYNQPIGLSLQAILLSLALGNRYNRINAERLQRERERDQLQDLDRKKTEFFMNISHELRTPLTVMLGLTRQLKEGRYGNSIEKNRNTLAAVERNGLRLLKQVNSLLRAGNTEAAAGSHLISVNQQLQVYVEEFQYAAQQRDIKLQYSAEKDAVPAVLSVNPDDLDSAVLNLLSNAVKYSKKGGSISLSLHLEKSHMREGKSLIISVSDTGPGVPEEKENGIFQRYKRYGGPRSLGTGLGLPVTKEIMLSYGGDAVLEENSTEGSRFSLIFPPETVHTEPLPHEELLKPECVDISIYTAEFPEFPEFPELPSTSEESPNPPPAQDAPVLLIVEDNKDLCRYITSTLEPDYRIVTADNGREALKILEKTDIDLIISDVMMPEMDGHAFYHEYNRLYPDAVTPFMFLTARDSLEEKIKSLKDGAVQYITKPFSPEEIQACVENILNRDRKVTRTKVSDIRRKIDQVLDEADRESNGCEPAGGRAAGNGVGAAEGHRAGNGVGKRAALRFDAHILKKQYQLTDRETEILNLLMQGASDKNIASELGISPSTVANHNRKLYKKLQVSGRFETMSKFSGR